MNNDDEGPNPTGVDQKTAEGNGAGGCSPHPDNGKPDKPAPFDPHAYRPNVEPPPLGADDPNAAHDDAVGCL